uniref:Ribosomal protein S11 n=1 Tax=Prasinoderma coloniale TaxID=156133 RepID=V9PA91_9VIRI|nr:ribosomal protein S11 [Prasinoderma coloniale]AGW52221.1 ribosomal protein S11 [Prasinoderma coloniale]
MSLSSDSSSPSLVNVHTQTQQEGDLRSMALQALRLRAKRIRHLVLRRHWSPAGSLPSTTLGGRKGSSLHWYLSGQNLVEEDSSRANFCEEDFPYKTRLQTLYTEGLETLSVSKTGTLQENAWATLQSGRARAQASNFSETLPTLGTQEGIDTHLLHKEEARFHARFYAQQKNRFPAYGCLHVTSVANNCFLGITDIWGQSLHHASTGSIGFTQKQRLTHPAFALGMKMAREAFQGGMKYFLLVVSGPGRGGSAAQAGITKVVQRHWKAARKEGVHPTFKRVGTLFVKKAPHNGCRLPAQRRKRRKTKVRPLRLGM